MLALSGLLMGAGASCSTHQDSAGRGLRTVVPDTVVLAEPEFLDAMSIAVGPPTTAAPATLAPVDSAAAAAVIVATDDPPVPAMDPLAAPLRRATFDFTGDTLVHSPLVRQAAQNAQGVGYDFAPMFAAVQPILSGADYSVCHLESPVAPQGAALSTFPVYGVPSEIATAIHGAGYDRCSTASNHTLDRGTAGIDATVDALVSAGVTQAGMARTSAEAVVSLVEVNGIAVAHLSYTFGFNGARLPPAEPWRSNVIDAGRIITAALDARARGADVVIASLHWGSEGNSQITAQQLRVADEVTASGEVDLIVGHHVHVIQPIQQINGRWVVFGMGNFLSNMPTGTFPPSSQDGMIVSVTVSEQADGTFAVDTPVVTPTWVDRSNGFLIRPVLTDLADPSVDAATKDQLYRSLQRTGSVVGAYITG